MPYNLLIVDDEEDVLVVLDDLFGSRGYSVCTAKSGQEALKLMEDVTPDLILADYKMPDMDGFALLGKLRESNPGLPVLAISGYAEETDISEHDFDGFIQKPVDLESFRLTVEKSLSRE